MLIKGVDCMRMSCAGRLVRHACLPVSSLKEPVVLMQTLPRILPGSFLVPAEAGLLS